MYLEPPWNGPLIKLVCISDVAEVRGRMIESNFVILSTENDACELNDLNGLMHILYYLLLCDNAIV